MSSNQAKMTLEERITQRIKDDTLMAVVGDEDAINELVKRALDEALFQPTRVAKQYGGWDHKDSPVIAASRAAAAKVAERMAEKLVDHLMASEEMRKAMLDHMMACLPAILAERFIGALDSVRSHTENDLRDKMRHIGMELPYD